MINHLKNPYRTDSYESVQLVLDDRLEVMKCVTSIGGGKAPGDGAWLRIALGLQGGDAALEVLHTCHPTAHLASCKDPDLDLGQYAGRASMFRCGMKLHALHNPASHGILKSFMQGSGRMRVEAYPAQCEWRRRADRPHRPAIGCNGCSQAWCGTPSSRHGAILSKARVLKTDWRCDSSSYS
jgi:hypothetical protein